MRIIILGIIGIIILIIIKNNSNNINTQNKISPYIYIYARNKTTPLHTEFVLSSSYKTEPKQNQKAFTYRMCIDLLHRRTKQHTNKTKLDQVNFFFGVFFLPTSTGLHATCRKEQQKSAGRKFFHSRYAHQDIRLPPSVVAQYPHKPGV